MNRTEHFWHGTRYQESADAIMKGGFSLTGAGQTGGGDYGSGVYATTDKGWAAEHAFGVGQQDRGVLMGVTINAANPLHGYKVPPHIHETAVGMANQEKQQHASELRRKGRSPEEIEEVTSQPHTHYNRPETYYPEAIQHHGHDAWFHGGHSNMAVVFDPSKITPTGENLSYRDYYGDEGDEEEHARWH